MSNVLVVGSVALDTVETPAGKAADILGGSATHFALSARHFAKVRLVGVVGKDFPAAHVKMLKKLGVDTEGLQVVPDGLTFRWHGKYDGSMTSRTTISVALNVLGTFQPEIPASYRDSKYVLLGNAHPATQLKVLEQLDKPAFVLLDTMDLWIDREKPALKELLPRVHALCINHEEAMMLSGERTIAKATRQLLNWGVRTLVLKKAEYGAAIAIRNFTFSAPAYPVEELIDPTGAGDSFAGGLLGYVAKKGVSDKSLKRAILYGSVMGSLCVESFGTDRLQTAKPAEIEKRYKTLVGMITL